MGRRNKRPRTPVPVPPSPPSPNLPAAVTIDGSLNEGGGQIVRTALALSAVFRTTLRIERIRAGRANPGLQAQHLAGARAVAHVSGAVLTGAARGASALHIACDEANVPADLPFVSRVETAGSVALVLQAALPAVLSCLASVDSVVMVLTGGTTAIMAPPSEYVVRVLRPNLKCFGVALDFVVERHGFYPKGGGVCNVSVSKTGCAAAPDVLDRVCLTPCNLVNRGDIVSVGGRVIVAGSKYIEAGLGQRMHDSALSIVRKRLAAGGAAIQVLDDAIVVDELPSEVAVGSCVAITMYATVSGGTVLGGSAIWSERDARRLENDNPKDFQRIARVAGGKGHPMWEKTAAHFGELAANELCDALDTGAAVDSHMADQLCVFMAMADGDSQILVPEPTMHLKSVIEVLRAFDVDIMLEPVSGSSNCLLKCKGRKCALPR